MELPQVFVKYLTSDGIVLPQGWVGQLHHTVFANDLIVHWPYTLLRSCDLPVILQGEGEKEEDWSDPSLDAPADADQAPSFPELLPRISAAISELGGRGVFPKLNWSAPKVGRLLPTFCWV